MDVKARAKLFAIELAVGYHRGVQDEARPGWGDALELTVVVLRAWGWLD